MTAILCALSAVWTGHCTGCLELLFWGLLCCQDVELADAFFAGHRAPDFSAFPYPRDLFLKFIAENDGALWW